MLPQLFVPFMMIMPNPVPSGARTHNDDGVVVLTIAIIPATATTVAAVVAISRCLGGLEVFRGGQRFWVGPDGGRRGPFAHSDRVARCHLHGVVGVSFQTCYGRAQSGFFYHDAVTALRELDGVNLDL